MHYLWFSGKEERASDERGDKREEKKPSKEVKSASELEEQWQSEDEKKRKAEEEAKRIEEERIKKEEEEQVNLNARGNNLCPHVGIADCKVYLTSTKSVLFQEIKGPHIHLFFVLQVLF